MKHNNESDEFRPTTDDASSFNSVDNNFWDYTSTSTRNNNGAVF
jgi:hypothetical protein